jgi:ketosteroid isomerase-like protein
LAAVARGLSACTLAFSLEREGRLRSVKNAGTYLMVLRRDRDGEWRITRPMWGDPVAQPN